MGESFGELKHLDRSEGLDPLHICVLLARPMPAKQTWGMRRFTWQRWQGSICYFCSVRWRCTNGRMEVENGFTL